MDIVEALQPLFSKYRDGVCVESLTLFENVVQIGHALNVCSGDVFVTSSNSIDLAAELF